MKETPRDPYTELGSHADADQRALRGAYLAKARRHHPDRGGDVRTMARINEAFELLRDPRRRAAYDAEHAVSERQRLADNPPWTGAAGPPPGRPSGAVLNFGLFAGWSLGEIARHDPGYLVWLAERREGRPYLAAIERYLAPMQQPASTPNAPKRGRR